MIELVCSEALQLLLTCLSAVDSHQKISNINLLCQEKINWDEFIKHVYSHKTTPLIYQVLNQPSIVGVPKKVLEIFKHYCAINTYRSLNMTANLITTIKLFDKKNISTIALKGPVLSRQLYGKLNMRESCDIDLFISIDKIKQANTILLEYGYQCFDPKIILSEKKFNFYIKHKKHFTYYHPIYKTYLELHWRLFENDCLFSLKFDSIWSNAKIENIASVNIRTINTEDNLLYLLTHGSQHAWQQLSWLADINQLLCNKNNLNWQYIKARAKVLKIELYMREGLFMANKLLLSPMPFEVISQLDNDKKIIELGCLTIKIITRSYRANQIIKILKFIRECKIQHALRYHLIIIKQFFNIVPADWEIISLPDSWFFIYYLLRPFLWIWRNYIHSTDD